MAETIRDERKSRIAREKTYYPTLAMLKKKHGQLLKKASVFDQYQTLIAPRGVWSVLEASLRLPAQYEGIKEEAAESFLDLINLHGERTFRVRGCISLIPSLYSPQATEKKREESV